MRKRYMLLAVVSVAVRAPAGAQQPDLTIGVESGAATEVFGHVRDVVVGGSGDAFILDNQALELRWFDRAGTFVTVAGGAGSAPGRFRSPVSLALDPAGDVLVLDPLNVRVSRFRPGAAGLTHVADIPAPPALDLCAMDDRLYLLRLRADSVITVIDNGGTVVDAWGSMIQPEPGHDLPPDEIREELDNRAHVLCDPEARTVTVFHERIPLVRQFSAAGDSVWSTILSDYHQVRDVHTPDESGWMSAPDPESGTAHSGRSIAAGADGTLVLTLYEGSAEGGSFEARVLSRSSGEELRRLDIPLTIAAVSGTAVIGYVNSPVPRVLRYDRLLAGRQ